MYFQNENVSKLKSETIIWWKTHYDITLFTANFVFQRIKIRIRNPYSIVHNTKRSSKLSAWNPSIQTHSLSFSKLEIIPIQQLMRSFESLDIRICPIFILYSKERRNEHLKRNSQRKIKSVPLTISSYFPLTWQIL